MTLKEQYQQAVQTYAPLDRIKQSILTGEYIEYIRIVIQLLTDLYNEQSAANATDFVVPQYMTDMLTSTKPY